MTWLSAATGGWITTDGKWCVRHAPSFHKPWFWLYGPNNVGVSGWQVAGRYTPTGRFEDAVGFATAREAKRYAETIG